MTTMADGLDAQDSSKSAFMEFGQQQPPPPQPPPPPHSQQSSPAMAGAHYPLHCLHSAAGSHPHHQHHHHGSPYSGSAGSYNHRSLAAYPYVSHSQHSPYLQSYHNSSAASQTRADDAGEPAPLPGPAARLSPAPSGPGPLPGPPGHLCDDPRRAPALAAVPGARGGGRRGGGSPVPAAPPGLWPRYRRRGPRSLRPGGGSGGTAALPALSLPPSGPRRGAAPGAPLLRRDRL